MGRTRIASRATLIAAALAVQAVVLGAGWFITFRIVQRSFAREIHDLTIRSFGVVRAVDTPTIEIDVLADERPAVNGSDAVMAAVAAAVWLADGTPTAWPTSR